VECLVLLLGGNSRGNVGRGGGEVWVGGGGVDDHVLGVPGAGEDILVGRVLGLVWWESVMGGFYSRLCPGVGSVKLGA